MPARSKEVWTWLAKASSSGDASRERALFVELACRLHRETDRLFFGLLVAQWLVAALLATTGEHDVVRTVLLGGAVNALPLALVVVRPGRPETRHAIAIAQMLWPAVLLDSSGGWANTQVLVFGSLAFLAFYRDVSVLVTASAVFVIEHAARGALGGDGWRLARDSGWVALEVAVLAAGCLRAARELHERASHEAELELTKAMIEGQVNDRTRELEQSVARYRALVENTDAVPFEYNPGADKVVYVAPQVARMMGGTMNPRIEREFLRALIHPDDRTAVREAIHAFAEGAPPLSIAYRLVRADGALVHVRTLLSDRGEDGTVVRGITIDTTKQVKLEAELRQAQKLESVGRLAAGVAHEINTPVQFVQDSLQFVRETIEDLFGVIEQHRAATRSILAGAPSQELAGEATAREEAADLGYLIEHIPQALDRASDGVARVTSIVRSMKAFAHPGLSERAAIDLNAAIENTLTIARNEYKYVADVQLELGDVPPVECHAGELNQVVLNLLVNAAHAISDVVTGTDKRGTITVRTRHVAGEVEISVGDTGGGIPDSIRDHIFEPFFTTKTVGRGTGQGLAISHSVIVDRHHGSLTFESEAGRGTTFTIRIPVAADRTNIGAAA